MRPNSLLQKLLNPAPVKRFNPSLCTRDRIHLALEKIATQPVLSSRDDLSAYARDESGLVDYWPDFVVHVKNTQQVSEILKLAQSEGMPVTPRGAGSGKSGGCVCVAGGVSLVLSNMNQILNVYPKHFYAQVEPGVITGEFQQAVESVGRFYPPDPASLAYCTLGGNAATNAGGPRAVKYGVTQHYVLGLEAVLPTGEVIQVGKRTAKGVVGYDLTSLIVGSEGTLAVITALTLQIVARPAAVMTALLGFSDLQTATLAVSLLASSSITPVALELLDKAALSALGADVYQWLHAEAQAALIVEIEAPDACLETEMDRLLTCVASVLVGEPQVACTPQQRAQVWALRRAVSEALKKKARYKLSEDIAVPVGHISELCAHIQQVAEHNHVAYAIYGHAGDGNLHVNVLWNDELEEPYVLNVLESIFVAAVRLGGTISGEHGVGLLKHRFIHLEQTPAVLAVQRQLKKNWDPCGILNPGKKI